MDREYQSPAEGCPCTLGSPGGAETARVRDGPGTAEALKLQARLEDLTVWERKLVRQSRMGPVCLWIWMDYR